MLSVIKIWSDNQLLSRNARSKYKHTTPNFRNKSTKYIIIAAKEMFNFNECQEKKAIWI